MTQNSFAGGGQSRMMPGVRVPIVSLLIVVVALALAQGLGKITGDDHLRWYFACFGVAFGIWTYVFYSADGYRISGKGHRAFAFIGLSVIGYGLVWLLYPTSISLARKVGIAFILSIPAILELLTGRPLFRRTPSKV